MKLICIPRKAIVVSRAAIFLIASNILLPNILSAQPGSLDNSFDFDGKLTTNFGNSFNYAYSVAIQSDGKIVVAGNAWNGLEYDFALVRYNSDGSLDNSFDTDGKLTTDFGNSNDLGWSVAIQNDGKIVVGGNSTNSIGSDFALARYNINGSLDSTFDMDGKLITDFGSPNDNGYSVTIQSNGKILLGGHYNNGSDFDFALVRYNSNGSLDNTFDLDGKLITDFGGDNEISYSVMLQSDGKILMGGYSTLIFGRAFAMVRYNSDGSLDNTFDSDGKLITDFVGSNNDIGNSIVIQVDGKILMAGRSGDGLSEDFALVRYNINGSLDNTFNIDGKLTTDFASTYDRGRAIAL